MEETTSGNCAIQDGQTENEPFRLKVKYNHSELLLPEKDAAIFAQKGMNYDKLQKNLEELKADEGLMLLDELTKSCGYSDRVTFLKELDALEKSSGEKELVSFFASHPELTADSLPDEVVTAYLNGGDLETALRGRRLSDEAERLSAENAELKRLLEIKSEEEHNDASANGAAGGSRATAGEYYTADELDALSDNDLNRNLERAIKSMSRLSGKNQ